MACGAGWYRYRAPSARPCDGPLATLPPQPAELEFLREILTCAARPAARQNCADDRGRSCALPDSCQRASQQLTLRQHFFTFAPRHTVGDLTCADGTAGIAPNTR